MPETPYDIETLLSPLSDEAPSGPALDYEPPFQALEQAGAGKPERQWGDKVYPAEPPDWPAVQELALPLATQSRDLRVAVWLLRCDTRLRGLTGALQGLSLVDGLLERLWDSVHPQLDASDGNDPTERLSALAPLLSPDALLADLRAAAVAPERGSITLRELELALGRAEPGPDEAQPTESGVREAMAALCQRHPGLAELLAALPQRARQIAERVERQIGAGRAPDFDPLIKLLALAPLAAVQPAGAPGTDDSLAPQDTAPGDATVPAAAGPSGAIRSRDDAVRALERVCEWIERHEPSNPAPLLIRRAQRLMSLSFLDIIRDLAPDALGQVEHIAGPQAQS